MVGSNFKVMIVGSGPDDIYYSYYVLVSDLKERTKGNTVLFGDTNNSLFTRSIVIDSDLLKIAHTLPNDAVLFVNEECVGMAGDTIDFTEEDYDELNNACMDYAEAYNEKHGLTIDTGLSVVSFYKP